MVSSQILQDFNAQFSMPRFSAETSTGMIFQRGGSLLGMMCLGAGMIYVCWEVSHYIIYISLYQTLDLAACFFSGRFRCWKANCWPWEGMITPSLCILASVLASVLAWFLEVSETVGVIWWWFLFLCFFWEAAMVILFKKWSDIGKRMVFVPPKHVFLIVFV